VSVYHYPLKRAEQTGNTSPACSALDSRLGDFSATTATFDTDNFDLADATANRLTTQFSHYSIGAVEASPAAGAQRQRTSMVTAYLALIKRCGRLIRG
jgi:hypothetical protein